MVDGDRAVRLSEQRVTETVVESSRVSSLGGNESSVLSSGLSLKGDKRSDVLNELVLVERGVGKNVTESLDEVRKVLTEELGGQNNVFTRKRGGKLATKELSLSGKAKSRAVGGVLESKLLKDVSKTRSGVVAGTGLDDDRDLRSGATVVTRDDLDTRNLLRGESATANGSDSRASSGGSSKHCV